MNAIVRKLPSAVTASVASPKMSDRYVHINTLDVVQIMNEHGFGVAETKVDAVTKRDPAFARHMVTFRKALAPEERNLTDYVPQFLFINSHNGTVKAQLALGVYRFVCMNGMVVGSTYAADSFKHSGDTARDVANHIRRLMEANAKLFSQIDAWKAKKLTKAKALELASTAAVLRFGEAKAAQYDAAALLGVRREEDDAGDAWSVFNRIQENATRGGFSGLNANGRRVTAKGLAGIGSDVTFNRQLWLATEEAVA